MVTYEQIQKMYEETRQSFGDLNAFLYTSLNPSIGPHGLFDHLSQAIGRLQDCFFILKRLYRGRIKLTEFAYQGEAGDSKIESELSEYMKLDIESLYVFGGMLLDQWAIISLYIIGDDPEKFKHPFHQLVFQLEKGKHMELLPVWKNYKADLLWLDYQIRFYRNRFVVHSDRPWQRGTTRSVYGDDFNLFIPSPPGWLDDERLNNEINGLIHLAPHIKQLPPDHW